MFLAGVSSVIYGLLVLIGALANYIQWKLLTPLLLEIGVGAVLLTAGWRAWREPGTAGFGAAFVTFLASIFFAYRFLMSSQWISACLLLAGFAALFTVLLGVFLEAQKRAK